MKDESNTLESLRARLEQLEAESTRSAKVQAALYKVAEAVSSSEDLQQFYAALHTIIGELMYAGNFFISVLDEQTGMLSWPYHVDEKDLTEDVWEPEPLAADKGTTGYVIRTGKSLHAATDYDRLIESGQVRVVGTRSLDAIVVPLRHGSSGLGALAVQSYTDGIGYTEEDVHVLEFVASHIATALTRARAIEETRRRNAELQIINSVQEGLASKLDYQGVIDLVGEKLRELFKTDDLSIRLYDEARDTLSYPYSIDGGVRDHLEPQPLGQGLTAHIIHSRQPLLINRELPTRMEELGSRWIGNTSTDFDRSFMGVPIMVADRVIGIVALGSKLEDAFSDADARLLQTITNSMGVALENARLFDETQRLLKETEQRNAELAIITSVQEGLASKLEIKAIYDVVGDRIREVFDAQAVIIGSFDHEHEQFSRMYMYEDGKRFPNEIGLPFTPLVRHLIDLRQPVVLNENAMAEGEKYGLTVVPGTRDARSMIFVPFGTAQQVNGLFSLQNIDREHAFPDSDVRLLQTLAGSMGIALENARLFDETQRLLKETEQRAAELAIINSVQEGLASKMEMQSIYELVGEKIRQTFSADTAYIAIFDPERKEFRIPYYVDQGKHLQPRTIPLGQGLTSEVYETRRPLLLNSSEEHKEAALHTGYADPSKDLNQSYLGVPILVGEAVTGVLSVQSHQKSAYDDAQAQLLSTLASSMSVALENARLFDETQRLLKETDQRAVELQIITSVQEGLASKLDIQAIYELVGDKVREIFNVHTVGILSHDSETGMMTDRYSWEKGDRTLVNGPIPVFGFRKHVIETRRSMLINRGVIEASEQYGNPILYGAPAKSCMFVPMLLGDRVTAVITLQDMEREDAFSESHVRLLETLASSMSVALENARLFDETQRLLKETDQRAAELQIINSVQEGLASKLEIQGIYDLVGDRIREVFDAQVVLIEAFDHERQDRRMFYAVENGERVRDDSPAPFNQLVRHLIEARQPLVVNENAVRVGEKYGMAVIPGTRPALSMVFVPFGTAEQINGHFSLQNVDREHAFSDSDVRLLQTLAGGMGIALENARLFEAERKRAAELAAINTVSQALVAEAELDKMIPLIGTQLLEIFKPDVAYVALLDRPAAIIEFPFAYGDDFPKMPYGQGLSTRIIDSQKPLLINKDIGKKYQELGTVRMGLVQASSYLGVPILAGGEAIGVISVQSTREENAFSHDDSRLLSTIAANAGAAIQTARLHTETQRRAQEMATLAEIGNDIAGTRELEPVLERIAAHAMSIMNVRDIAITLRDDNETDFRAPVALGRYADEMRAMVVRPGVGIMGHILQAGVPELVNDPMNDVRRVTVPGTPEVEEDPECLMGAPLVSRGRVIGGLMVWRLRRNGLFTQAELDFLVSVARQTTIAIESARLYLETQRRANEMSALAEVGREISASLDKTAVLELIAGRAMELLGAENSSVFLLQPQGGVMRAIAARGDASEALRAEDITLGEGIIGSLAAEGRAAFINDVFHDPRGIVVPGMNESETERLMAAPLTRGDDVVGMLAVWRTTAPFNQSDLNFLIGLSRQAAIAFENARLFDEIKRQGAYLETIFLNSPVAIVTVDEYDNVMSWSPAAEKLFGYASAEAVGRNVDQLVANEELIRAEAVSYTEQGKHNQYVHRVTRRTRKDGTLVDVDLSALPLPLEGGKTGVVAIYNDVGEIQRQRKYYEAIVQNSPVAIVTIDQSARVQSWNPGAESLFGYPREEAIGENLDDLVAGTDETHEEAESYNLLARNRELHVITKRTRKDGTPVEVELSGVPLPLPTGESGLVAIYHDITELQRARQEAVAANEAKSAFLATMSHEIRTPMNAVIGMSGLLMDTALNPEQRDYAETIRNSGDALLTIINDILDFSKIEAGKMELESQPFDLRECVESAMDLVAGRANEKKLDLAYIIEDEVPPGVRGDVTRLRQVLLNLISNAVKFTEKGEVVLTVRADKEPDRLLISVRDSGIGIPRDRMGRLFESFSQADSSTTRKFGGTGLGLAISKRLAEMMGGTMWADSAGAGKGSTFSFTLRAPAARVTTRKSVRELNGIQPALNGKHVLIVDDNDTNRRILMLQTGKWGMRPRETASPREALRLLKTGAEVDLAILDVQMPAMDGVTLAREVRKLRSRTHLPLILLTSLGRNEAGAEDLDVAAFLTKPLKPSGLFDALVGIFGQHIAVPRAESSKAAIDVEFAREHPLRILLAEDNAVNQKLALRLLEQMGYRADVASNGVEAVESIERQGYDVVLMDVQMPEMDGLDATRAIRKLTGITQPRVIAMTANAMQGDREMCLAAGMDDYVSKPIRVAELIEALRGARRQSSKPAARARKKPPSTARPSRGKSRTKAGARASSRPKPRRAARSGKK